MNITTAGELVEVIEQEATFVVVEINYAQKFNAYNLYIKYTKDTEAGIVFSFQGNDSKFTGFYWLCERDAERKVHIREDTVEIEGNIIIPVVFPAPVDVLRVRIETIGLVSANPTLNIEANWETPYG